MSWMYGHAATGSAAHLFVAWFQSQRNSAAQPHSPQVCLPGNGWTVESPFKTHIATAAGPLPVTQAIAAKGPQRDVVIYWYQTAGRASAGEWESKLWLAADVWREKRSDIALVRVVVSSMRGYEAESTKTATRFAADVYPLMREALPK
jgi:EpsI family protein